MKARLECADAQVLLVLTTEEESESKMMSRLMTGKPIKTHSIKPGVFRLILRDVTHNPMTTVKDIPCSI